MSPNTPEYQHKLDYHLQFLGRIYTFTGWLGILGSTFLLLAPFCVAPETAIQPSGQSPHLPQAVQAALLACWSVLLLNFSHDIRGRHGWSTGKGGWCLALLHLVSVPIGTAIGAYTLWVLFRHSRSRSRQAELLQSEKS